MKTIAIYGVQAAMGLTGLAAGVAKLAGADIMVDAFDMLGLGSSFRLMAGLVEVLGGVCLLMPKAGVIWAVLLASVVMGTAGLTIGQVAGKILPGSEFGVVRTQHAVSQSGSPAARAPAIAIRDGISI